MDTSLLRSRARSLKVFAGVPRQEINKAEPYFFLKVSSVSVVRINRPGIDSEAIEQVKFSRNKEVL